MEESENHECIPSHKGDKRIEISQWWESKTERGEPLVMAFGSTATSTDWSKSKRAGSTG
jgi:hypothetical protein